MQMPHPSPLLSAAVRDLGTARDLPMVTSVVRRAARALTGADGVTFVLRDGDQCHYVDEDAIAPLWKGQRFPMEACISGWVMRQGRPAVIPDISIDARIPQEAYRPTFVRSLAMLPVRTSEPVAAIGAYWAAAHEATAEELETLQQLADNAALALENIGLRRALAAERRARAEAEAAVAHQREIEAALRESEMRFRIMADATPLIIWVTDAGGGLEFVNQAFREFFGVTEDEVRGPKWLPLVHPDDVDAFVPAFLSAVREGRSFAREVRVRRADGRWRHLASFGAPRFSPDGRVIGMAGSSPDITELKEAMEQASDAARVRDEFLATVTHELRQPLHAAMAALGVFGARGNGEDRTLGVLGRQLRHMTRLVDDLLDASRVVRGDVSLTIGIVDLREVVRQAVETMAAAIAERRHAFEVAMPERPVPVEGDAVRLQQVLVNLLSNAVKYTPPGGRIHLSVTPEPETIVIRVRDTGVGIPARELQRIFDVFVRAPGRSEAGFGLGLPLARTLVECHGGSLEAHSDGDGRGSEFLVRLPAPPPD